MPNKAIIHKLDVVTNRARSICHQFAQVSIDGLLMRKPFAFALKHVFLLGCPPFFSLSLWAFLVLNRVHQQDQDRCDKKILHLEKTEQNSETKKKTRVTKWCQAFHLQKSPLRGNHDPYKGTRCVTFAREVTSRTSLDRASKYFAREKVK